MHRYKCSNIFTYFGITITFVLVQCILTRHQDAGFVSAGASSTPKNLVNLYTPTEGINLTQSSNQFQNEYQYRQSASKSSPAAQSSTSPSSDRYKSSTSSLADAVYSDSLTNDLGPPTFDYSYQDSRAMTNVPDCKGRLRLNGTRGYITDGPGYYQTNLQCIWLIDSGRNNATVRIRFHQFNTECNYDFLYIFDGDSIYSPLVAALSGDMKDFNSAFIEENLQNSISNGDEVVQANTSSTTTNTTSSYSQGIQTKSGQSSESRSFELKLNSGKAFIYFHSDTAQSMPGFYMTYSIDSCPLDCSNRGECDYTSLTCRCNSGYFGEGCQYIYCPNNCTTPLHGTCDKTRSCLCNDGFTGADCSKSTNQQLWETILSTNNHSTLPRAFHKVSIVDDIMWIFGGRSHVLSNTNIGILKQKQTPTILAFDLSRKNWTETVIYGTTGQDHLAELTGHSIAATGNKVFIFGGMALNNSVLNTLTVFDTKTQTLTSIVTKKKSEIQEEEFVAPLATTGHSANIVDGQMFVFWGYNPLYGYLNFVQKFNTANNTWSIIERKGSSVGGYIGHTSSFDPVGRLIYVYGGHNLHISNRLYSFDPKSEVWTFLHSGPSPRYYHSSIILNGRLIVFGGNSYNTSHQSDICFQQTYLSYNLNCSEPTPSTSLEHKNTSSDGNCGRKCWTSIDESSTGILKRHGHSVVVHNDDELVLFGGFNGVLMNDIRSMKVLSCMKFTSASECNKAKIALSCHWDFISGTCHDNPDKILDASENPIDHSARQDAGQCPGSEALQKACETRETCTDCLNTNLGCVWCGPLSQCQYNKCRSLRNRALLDPDLCYKSPDDPILPSSNSTISSLTSKKGSLNQMHENELDCKLIDNCYLCQSKPQCSWQHDACTYNFPAASPMIGSNSQEEAIDFPLDSSQHQPNSTRLMHKLEPLNKSFLTALTTSLLNSSPYTSCDAPCYVRQSCNECTTTKCIWCSTTEQCIDSSAYFAYHSMGQCMHYVAHMLKCPSASCSDIETCDKCLTNPKCGWMNDPSNTGKGRCTEGDSSQPSNPFTVNFRSPEFENSTIGDLNGTAIQPMASPYRPNWYYTTCPSCQCNGHSFCKPGNNVCVQPCQGNTEGPHCDRCVQGYFGYPINGGVCRPCRCNGHAQTCNRETGRCYCSVKGIIGHNCDRCDDKNYYIGNPSSQNGTCYYNLTTDYQYTFNMSKPEDHFYSEINFINVPLRKESDADFSIACSRLALVNITSGTNYKNRRPIHTGLECGSFRLRFPHDRHNFTDSNYSIFVHVYKFQTPFILQIAFSQQRTLYLPQFFFSFLSCFLFFFALSGAAWKLKHEYDLYVRRQRQFIEMEQMASRPFSTILLELVGLRSQSKVADHSSSSSSATVSKQLVEPTPISFEPCFSNNVGVLSVFVQLPGRPNLAIGSALVSLNDETSNPYDDENEAGKRLAGKQQEHTATKNI